MKAFMDKDFLLQTDAAKELYHEHAAKMPIIDYHCHLIPKMVADNKRFESIAQIWLMGDHYKWRAMRSFGIDERLITGDASYKEKFLAFASMIPYAVGNPLYHWTHLELARYFGVKESLTPKTAEAIFEKATVLLSTEGYSAHSPGNDLGVITPTAALSSFPYSPEQSMAALKGFYARGESIWGKYGFYDAFSPSSGWTLPRYLAIDQCTIAPMIENYRTGLLWRLFMSCPEVQQGLAKLGIAYPK